LYSIIEPATKVAHTSGVRNLLGMIL